jgi:hypothetical protein
LAVKVDAVATPEALLVCVSTLVEVLAKVPLEPVPGALKVTTTPDAGRPELLVKATDMAGKAVPAWALERVVAVVEGLGVIVGTAAYARAVEKIVTMVRLAAVKVMALFAQVLIGLTCNAFRRRPLDLGSPVLPTSVVLAVVDL